MRKITFSILLALAWALLVGSVPGSAAPSSQETTVARPMVRSQLRSITTAQRLSAAAHRAQALTPKLLGPKLLPAVLTPGATPDYFNVPNWANSLFPTVTAGVASGGIRKFIDRLAGLGPTNANNLGNYLPVATPDTITYPGSDYYEINLVEYTSKFHTDLPATKVRGYVQVNNGTDASNHNTILPAPVQYLGPIIVATSNRPVRVKFTNKLPIGAGGNLFIPVDTTAMGAGMGPYGMTPPVGGMEYTQNRAVIHLHGGATPWISDGTPHQWITPAGEITSYPKGVSATNVPDMPDPGDGSQTFFYTNQQSARLMFYHDHAYGITRLNVYAGEVAGYLITDNTEKGLVTAGVLPTDQIPLLIQDKTFVPDTAAGGQLANTDPTWDPVKWGGTGSLWFPHVYMPNQNPNDPSGANAFGRWDYGPWFWPPVTAGTGLVHGPVTLPSGIVTPGTPDVSMVMEAFMDTPMVNGTVYPFLPVQRKAYRFRILNGCNDRYLNLQLYYAISNTPDAIDPTTQLPTLQTNSGEVAMVPAIPLVAPAAYPAGWPTADARVGGWPDPTKVGPSMIQIGTEGGFLPAPVVLPNTPIGYELDKRNIVVLNVKEHTLFLGPAERADVVIDFSGVPDGSKLILYNDAPAPLPAGDPRLDYYTGDPDLSTIGGAPTTLPGYGPNTRTIMQFQVSGATAAAPFNLTNLQTALPTAFGASQPPIIVPQATYPTSLVGTPTNAYSKIADTALTFAPLNSPVTGVTVTAGGSGYTTAPTVGFTGVGTGAAATATIARVVSSIAVTFGGTGYTTAPAVVFTGGGGGSGAAATATVAGGVVTGITVTTPGSGYTTRPTVSLTGGGGTGAVASATLATVVTGVTMTSGGTGYTTAPTVAFTGGGGTGAAATAVLTTTIPMQPKAIQELFELDYGRMNSTLGVELPLTNFNTQTTIPYGYIDPPTESFGNGETQVWKITHNGVDTHAIHFHLFNVQLINRVGWDGQIRPPDANELGWKETVRMNPLEDAIVALRPVAPTLPFNIPDSVRPLDPTMPLGSTMGFSGIDPLTGNPVPGGVQNIMTNFGWEYVWHCHLLGHEEMDMMRPMVFHGPSVPGAPTLDVITPGFGSAVVNFTAPFSTGSLPLITNPYTVTANPGGITATGAGSPITVPGLTPGGTYTFSVTATNGVGTGPASAISAGVLIPNNPAVAGAPTAVVATAGNGQATVGFAAPAYTGTSPITFYTVTSTPGGKTASGNSTQLTVTGLTNGTPYYFTVTATNGSGAGPASAPSNTVTPATLPGAPTIGTAVRGNGQASISYTAPASNGGSAITSYTMTATPGGKFTTGTANPLIVTGLTNGTPYTFSVTATNGVGTGPASALSNSVTPATVPGAPTITTTTPGNGQVTVAFTAPGSNGGDPITSYTVTASNGNFATGAGSPLTVTGLTNGTAYTFTVTATNGVGTGPASAPPVSATPATLPGAPAITTLAVASATGITVNFTAPASNGGSAITSYKVTASPGGKTASGAGTALTVTGLTTGTTYTFTVTATNGIGTGPASGASSSITLAAPTAPTLAKATASAISVSLPTVTFTWKDNANNEDSFTIQRATNAAFTLGLTSISVPANTTSYPDASVAVKTTYYYRVQAVNVIKASTWATATPVTTPGLLPAAPSGLTSTGTTTTSISLKWTDNSTNETGFNVQRLVGGVWVNFARLAANSTTYTNNGLTRNTSYSYRVVAFNLDGNSAPSNIWVVSTAP